MKLLCVLLGLACAVEDLPDTRTGAPDHMKAAVLRMDAGPTGVKVTNPGVRRVSLPSPDFPTPMEGCEVEGPNKYDWTYLLASQKHGWHDPCYLKAQDKAESDFYIFAISVAGAKGIAQFMPGTARDMGIDPFNPWQSIYAQAKYMKWCAGQWKRYGRTLAQITRLAAACYNWGLRNLLRTQELFGGLLWVDFAPHAPAETRQYIVKIEAYLEGQS